MKIEKTVNEVELVKKKISKTNETLPKISLSQ